MAYGKSPANLVDMTGLKFNRLTVLSRAGRNRAGQALWSCVCDCGKTVTTLGTKIRGGYTKSCGCIKGHRKTHGMSGTRTHNTWLAMKQRCNYPLADEYANYGGRGIKVCDRWSNSFEAFMADMGERPQGMTIERNDNDGNYGPGNCRWVPISEQARNRRSTIRVERDGITKCVLEWCRELRLKPDTIYSRIRRGMSPQEALR